jgi:hypothetical protein
MLTFHPLFGIECEAIPQRGTTTRVRRERLTSAGGDLGQERVGRCEPQGDTGADNESSVDQAGQQEHLGLKFAHEFGLTCGRLEVLAAHDADADTCAHGAQTDDQAGGQCNKANNFHDDS